MNSIFSPKIITLLVVTIFVCGCSPAAKKARVLERADRYFKAGDYDKAKIEYMNVLRLDHQNVTAFEQLGLIWSEEGVPLRAIPFLLKVRELAPQNNAARSKLALGFMVIGQSAEARKEAISILKQDPANTDAILVLADSSRGTEEIAGAEQELAKFPQKNTAAFHLAKASMAIKKNDLGAASDEVQQALAAEPKSARAHLVMAYLYLLRKNPSHAGPEFKAAAELAPVRSDEQIKYAEFQVSNGAADAARAILQQVTKKAPDYLPAWRGLAQIAFTEKKYDEATSFLENIFSRDPDNPEAGILQAQVWMAKGDPAKGISILDRLNNTYPNNAVLKYQLARAYVLSNSLTQATAAMEQAIAAKPDFVEAILLLTELNLRAGKAQAAVTAMEDLLKTHPDLAQAKVLLASAYQVAGRLDNAVSLFREQVQKTPESPDAHFVLGVILRQQNKNAEARGEFEKSSELMPDNWLAIDHLVEIDIAEKNLADATPRVEAYVARKPNEAPGHYMLGKIYSAQQSWAAAEAEFKKAIDLDPNFGVAYNALVSVYVTQNKLPQAISELESALKQRPGDGRVLLTMGLIYDRMKDYPKARDVYEKVLVTSPDAAGALNNLAYLYAERFNQLDRAYELAQKARHLQPEDGSIADSLAWILYKRGDYQQALSLLEESAGKLPDNPEVQFHLGMAASMMGQTDAARTALEKAAHATVDFPGKDEAQRRLASLQVPGRATGEPGGDLARLQKQQPNDVLALINLAKAHEQKGELAEAAAAYEQALKLNPRFPDAALKLAQLYAGPLHKPDEAIAFARKARELARPNDSQSAGVLGRIAFQAGNFSWAYSLLQESARQNNKDATVLRDLALATYALGRVPEARQAMERAMNVQPNGPQAEEIKRFLAMTALDGNAADMVAAQSEVQRILKTEPDYVPALMVRAAIQRHEHEAKAATETYSKVLQEYPDFAPAQKRLAAIYADNPDNQANAYDLAMKARKTLPDDPDLALTLAEISFNRNEFPYAIQLFQQSAVKQALPAKDLYYLGMAQLQTRQEAKGRETLQRALSAGLQNPMAEEAKKRLAQEPPK